MRFRGPSSRRLLPAAALAACVLVPSPGTSQGAQAAEAPAAVEIAFGAASGFPGAEATIPIELAHADDAAVGAVAFTIAVPEATTFRAAEGSYGLQESGGRIDATSTSTQGRPLVTVTIEAGGTPLPAGVVGYLVLAVDPGAPLGDRDVKAVDGTARSADGAVLQPVRLLPAKMSIVDPKSAPLVACFFYMH